jgi:uncharacterized RDD family membrane protein YckC
MSEKSKSTAFLLCYFFGLFGVHRFYVGKVKTGLLMLVTLGGLGIWWMVDSVLIAAGQFKDRDAQPLRTGPPDPDNPAAGFWVRVAAMSVDTVVLTLVVMVVLTFAGFAFGILLPHLNLDLSALEAADPNGMMTEEQAATSMIAVGAMLLIEVILLLIYFGIQHGSRHQATVGKRCFDIKVIAGNGDRLGYGRAMWRTIGYIISAVPLYLGYVLAAFTRDKRALHDYLAGTRVQYATAESGDMEISPDSVTIPNMSAAPIAAAMAKSSTVEKSSSSGTIFIAAGALLLAGAAAVGLLL